MTVISIQQKLQRGRKLLSKAGNEPDLLGPALGAIHGALEDACRMRLSAPHIQRQHRIDVTDNSKASWKVLLELMERYCGWSRQDAKYVSQMNYLRNQTAHGGEFQGTRRQVEQYLGYVENAVEGGAFSPKNTNRRTNRQTRSNKPYKHSLPTLWIVCTFGGVCIGVFLYFALEPLSLSLEGNREVVAQFFTSMGLMVGLFQYSVLKENSVLKEKIKQSWQWIIATTLGYASLAILYYIPGISHILELIDNSTSQGGGVFMLINIVFMLSLLGAIVGFWQWLVLRLYFRRAVWWIVASAISHGLGFFILSGFAGFILPWIIKGGKVN